MSLSAFNRAREAARKENAAYKGKTTQDGGRAGDFPRALSEEPKKPGRPKKQPEQEEVGGS